jgi:hypothetical protein
MPRFALAFVSAKDALTESDILEIVPVAIKTAVETAITDAIASTCEKDIKKTIQVFQQAAAETLLNQAIVGSALTVDLQAAATRIQENRSTIQQELKLLETAPIVQTLTGQIQKQRGTRMEAKAEDEHGMKTGVSVSDRNTPVRHETPEYILVGYIDGTHGQRVIETKNRKHFWGTPPEYDLIQLKCYMKMRGDVEGVLLERFPTGDSRETLVTWDDDEWETIDRGLRRVANDIKRMTLPDAETIVKSVLMKTDKKNR